VSNSPCPSKTRHQAFSRLRRDIRVYYKGSCACFYSTTTSHNTEPISYLNCDYPIRKLYTTTAYIQSLAFVNHITMPKVQEVLIVLSRGVKFL
jgi:hypothetical protein